MYYISLVIKMSAKDKKTQAYFDKTLLEHKDFSQWVAEIKNKTTKCWCKICHKTNGFSNIGIGPLKIHYRGSTYKDNAKKINNFCRRSTLPTSTHAGASHYQQSQCQVKIDEIVTYSAVIEAEMR